jgi:two-component system nitrogen regulation sensor histidine kinase NtrY
MRLRSQLILLTAVSSLPFLVALPWALAQLQQVFDGELDARLVGASRAAQAAVVDLGAQVERAVKELAGEQAIEEVARTLHSGEGDRAAIMALGERLMALSGLDALELLDAEGRILTSGHLPARAGDPDRAALELGRTRPGKAAPMRVEVKAPDGLAPALAMLAARPVDYGRQRVYVVGGRLIGADWARQLAELTGAAVAVRDLDREIARTNSLAAPRARRVALRDGEAVLGAIQVELSDAGLRATRSGIARAAAALWLALFGAALALGVVLAARISRPVAAVARGATDIAAGELGREVAAPASGELRELVEAFNAMSRDLRCATERAAVAERVAAWQGVARRLAHEIKNPLTPIRMSLETLLAAHRAGRPDFDEIFKESAGAMLEEVERLRRIVDEFSKFARLPKPLMAEVDLAELAGQVLSLWSAPDKRAAVERELEPGLSVMADRDQLTQVLINLLTNADQAMAGRPGAIAVRALEGAPGEAWLEVEDRGPGVKPEDRGRIFEPYYTTKETGTGLGLAIALRIAQEHGGRLEEVGKPGCGALFRLALPRRASR